MSTVNKLDLEQNLITGRQIETKVGLLSNRRLPILHIGVEVLTVQKLAASQFKSIGQAEGTFVAYSVGEIPTETVSRTKFLSEFSLPKWLHEMEARKWVVNHNTIPLPSNKWVRIGII